jgi:hypothetical protein
MCPASPPIRVRRYLLLIFFAIVLAAFSDRDSRAQGRVEIFVANPQATATPTRQARRARRVPAWPVDELKDDESFNEFRGYLRDAIRRQDSNAIRRVLSHDFVAAYCCEGAPRGREAIAQWWKSVETPGPDYGNFWRILADALKFGVKKSPGPGTVYCGPAFKVDGAPGEVATIVIANSVPLRKEPRVSSPVVADVSWEAVDVPQGFGMTGKFVLVSTDDGRSGYVDDHDHVLRQPDMDPQVCFTKEPNGEWAIGEYNDGGD